MADKLSDRLWDILNDATLRNALTATQLCAIDEARALAKRVEDAPVVDSWTYWADHPQLNGKYVRLVVDDE
jgi:exo-beta-1,3-glucanase (GH17 family)